MRDPQQVLALHRWDVTPAEARALQLEWRARLERRNRLGRIRRVAGADVAFDRPLHSAVAGQPAWKNGEAVAGVVVFSYPDWRELDRASARCPVTFPYVPGLLSFREIPAILAALARLREQPDLIFCDAQGYAHPRRFGLASHLGVLLDVPTIGCAKSRLIGRHREPGRLPGAWAPLMDARERIGAVLRTRAGSRPIYISIGHRVSLERAVALTIEASDGRRIPLPTRRADRYVAEAKRTPQSLS
ncbi:MAG TPA: deoxyribonuclease V [Candidatus Acidoferrales bacterium]|nr:deoxyribonuclease V [Candidatus Acidoferrales bacterium]